MSYRGNRGFTLIELVMVIVLLGVLAAVAVPKYYDLRDEAETASIRGIFSGIQSGISLYYAKNKAFPKDAQEAYDASGVSPGDFNVQIAGNAIIISGKSVTITGTYDPANGILKY